ncbi:hypothetical protein HNY73_019028 [Argiope bruennichi]|uniref:ATP-dependent DNA helicase n=1 Tax=Argiope bruennichi TaxID=94029 RepID=A0A8T0EF59_ARGBR|nr:hypothetical protein HNY73_019028 [Argiope bruennichi]
MDTTDNNADVLRCFVSGTGDTGKCYLIKTLKVWVKTYLNKKVAVSAPTGIAAFNVNRLTIHRLLQLPVEHKQTPKYKPLSDEVLQVRDQIEGSSVIYHRRSVDEKNCS